MTYLYAHVRMASVHINATSIRKDSVSTLNVISFFLVNCSEDCPNEQYTLVLFFFLQADFTAEPSVLS